MAQTEIPPPDWTETPQAISTLHADSDGDTVPDRIGDVALVAGRVSAGTGVLRADQIEIYIQDATGGLRLMLPPDRDAVLTGDSVMVYGEVSFREGMVEMAAPAIRTIDGPPVKVPTSDLEVADRVGGGSGPDLEAYEGRLVQITGRVIEIDANSRRELLVLISGTDLVQVISHKLRPSPVSFEGVELGDQISVRGIAGQSDLEPPFDRSYTVTPLVEDDVRRGGISPTEYRNGALVAFALLVTALLWAVLLRRTVRRRSEELRASEVRYGHLFDAAADAVMVLDVENGGEIVEANRAAQRAFGITLYGNRPDGRTVRLADLATDEHDAARHLADADREGAGSGILELNKADGTLAPYEIATRRLRDGGGQSFVAVARDVAERRAYELGLLQAIAASDDARERAESAARLQSSILANMSHEVRTPLTAVLGFADILRTEVRPELYEYADSIHTGGQRLLNTLNDILDLARLDAEQASLVPEHLDAAVVIRDAVAVLAPLAQRKRIGLHLQSAVSTLPVFMSNSALARITTNLVGNAIKFTEHGDVHISLHAEDTFFALRVQDTGVGISEDFLPDLFVAFKQESDGHGRDFEGTGLGLAITKRMVTLMGGEIRVWSEKGEGTLFEVSLPREVTADDLLLSGDGQATHDADPVLM
ncbi:ATP-binding protein [Rubrivirga sp.]|uniref:ATP-binding protein n=1 Tax=Rubrivirga sp. TaxID=1885344 RepID=UPI003C7480C0